MKKIFLLLMTLNGFLLHPLNAVFLETTTKSTNKFLFSNGKTLSLSKNLHINLLNNPEAIEIINAKNIIITSNEISKKYKKNTKIQTIINLKYITLNISNKFSYTIKNDSIFIFPSTLNDHFNIKLTNKNITSDILELNTSTIFFNNNLNTSSESEPPEIDESFIVDLTIKDRMSINRIISFENQESDSNEELP